MSSLADLTAIVDRIDAILAQPMVKRALEPLHDVCDCELEECGICREWHRDNDADSRQRQRMGD